MGLGNTDPTMSFSPTAIGRIAALVEPIIVNAGDSIGPYTVVETIGEGGFGVVYLAEQREPVRRRVALKVVKPGMDTAEVLARFEVERQALALIDHPNVARVFDAGVSAQGRPYFAMEYVPGRSITKFAAEQGLGTRERLELFISVCHAVQHAHQKGIIHRDLKPSNILVTTVDDRPEPKVIDFGIAKASLQPLTDRTLNTLGGRLLGTPEYMSPEQAGPNSFDVDTRADVYSLGVVLYELLAGALPFDPGALRESGYEAIVKMIRESEPRKPSTRARELSPAGGANRIDRRTVSRELRGDLDWIVLKAMDKDRSRRYETANALAIDIRRHLSNEPVMAGPPSATYRFSKFARRNKGPLLAVGAVALALVGGLIAAGYGLVQAQRERDLARDAQGRAQTAATDAVKQRDFAKRSETEASVQRDAAIAAKTEADLQRRAVLAREMDLSKERYRLHVAEAKIALDRADAARAKAELWACPKEVRRWEWYHLAGRVDESLATLYQPGKKAQAVIYTKDGSRIVCGGRDITVWDARTLRPLRSFGDALSEAANDQYRSLALSPDGKRLLTARIWDEKADLWDFEKGQMIGSVKVFDGASGRVNALNKAQGDVQFSPDGSQFLISGWVVRTYDADTLAPLHEFVHGHYVRGAAYSPDGSLIATAGNDSNLRLWDARTGKEAKTIALADAAWSVSFSPDGKHIAVGGQSRPTALVFEVQTGQLKQVLVGEGTNTNRLTYSPDGSVIAAASSEGVISLWSTRTGALLRTMLGAVTGESGIVFSPDGKQLVTPQWSGYARAWDVSSVGLPALDLVSQSAPQFPYMSANGSRLVTIGLKGASLWDLSDRVPRIMELDHDAKSLWYVAVSPEGDRAATFGRDGTMKVWNADGKLEREWPRFKSPVVGACFAPGAQRVALVQLNGAVSVLDSASGNELFSARTDVDGIAFGAFSADGSLLAIVTRSSVRVWNLATGQEAFNEVLDPSARAAWVAISPDAARLAAFWENGASTAWDIKTHRKLFDLAGSRGVRAPQAASFSGDGQRLAVLSLGNGGTNSLRMLEVEGGREVYTLDSGRLERFIALAFVPPDRERLIAVTSLGAVRELDIANGRRRERSMELREEAKAKVNGMLASMSTTDLNNERTLLTRDNRSRAMEAVLEQILADGLIPEDLRRAAVEYMVESETGR